MECMGFNQRGDISILKSGPLKLMDKFTYQGSSVSSTKKDINTQPAKAWTAINRLLVIWKSDLTDEIKCSFFQAVVVSILLYGCTTRMLTKWMEKKLDSNYTRMLRAILNKFWRQHPTKQQLYGYLPPIPKTIQVRQTRHVGYCWRSKDELISDILLWTPSQRQDNQLEPICNSSVSGRFVLAARHGDDGRVLLSRWLCKSQSLYLAELFDNLANYTVFWNVDWFNEHKWYLSDKIS